MIKMPNKKVFVLMPFSGHFNDLYLELKELGEKHSLDVIRADEDLNQESILQCIVREIQISDLIIADLSDKNPNVYYELGIAHCIPKKVILISQDLDDLPFDIDKYRVIPYKTDFAEFKKFIKKLEGTFIEYNNGNLKFSNPYLDFKVDETIVEKLQKIDTVQDGIIKEMGWVEYAYEMDKAIKEIVSIFDDHNTITKVFNISISKCTKEWEETKKSNANDKTAEFYRICGDITNNINKYSLSFENVNRNFEAKCQKVTDYSVYLIEAAGENIFEELKKEELQNFIEAHVELVKVSNSVKSTMIVLRNSVDNIRSKRIQAGITISCNKLISELNQFTDSLDKLIKITTSNIRDAENLRDKNFSQEEIG